ncbi:ATP-binding protein [Hamadaea tsunoensis]|uniref:ATP-binding protein n=1 Tax=Hamadaea tsunoensis TaxID=53368 RepID=UPI00041522BF|nr:DUF87 domain-containing protein [Hamadaea tsunoensis]
MKDDERRALQELRLSWAPAPEDVWRSPAYHVEGMNGEAADGVMTAFRDMSARPLPIPLGIVLEGQAGAGKTHLLSWVRAQVQNEGGYFFLLGIPQQNFWECLVQAFLDGLFRDTVGHRDQLTKLLAGLCDHAMFNGEQRAEILGKKPLTRDALEDFVRDFRMVERVVGASCQYTLRALVLLGAVDSHLQDLGEGYLRSAMEIADTEERGRWNLLSFPKSPKDVVTELSRLLAVTGPTVVAVDQIDLALAQVRRASTRMHVPVSDRGESADAIQLLEEFGHGLMAAREQLHRTVLVVSCLTTTWQLICEYATASIAGRFRQEMRLSRIPTPEVGIELLGARFAAGFAAAGFTPPHPTWPIERVAFDDVLDYTPRSLLQNVDTHIRLCLRRDEVIPLTNFDLGQAARVVDHRPAVPPERGRFERFDEEFEAYRKQASVDGATQQTREDELMPGLLHAGLTGWIREKDEQEQKRFAVVEASGGTTVHAELRESFDDNLEDYGVWYFRGLARQHHAALLPRLERVMRRAALDPRIPHRRAVLLRNISWPNGPTCKDKREKFESLGGMIKEIADDDLRTFAALRKLLDADEPGLDAWLADRRPASRTRIFTEVFGAPEVGAATDADQPDDGGPATPFPLDGDAAPDGQTARAEQNDAEQTDAEQNDSGEEIPLGTARDGGESITLRLSDLRKHVAIFAGSGSGKTVLIRRIVEECALRGVSAIALDPNNDLARLGDAWPSAPAGWGPGDGGRAAAYLEQTDVVVWTPRREAGRPLSMQPLPDFRAVVDDADEFGLALDSAVAALAPRARVGGNTAKMDRGRAVLREALAAFARGGGTRLAGFVELLEDLPDGVTSLGKASDLGYEMAQTLKAAMINDPLFGGAGQPLDPGVLLTPPPGKRARVSLISLIGLPTDEQRQSFVNQLQMALFGWIKQHPANDRALGGLFVMDEAQTLAPSGATTACTESTLALASQARKYGLGLVFATQAPRGIHNRIVGNAATHFYGFLNSPVQISAAQEVAQARGSARIDIAQLRTGEFYVSGESVSGESHAFRRITAPLCLSHHPSSALTPEEVLSRSRG